MPTRLEKLVGHRDDAFCIYRSQPLLLLASRWGGRRWITFVVMLAILVVPRIIVSVAGGSFASTADPVADLGSILLGRPVLGGAGSGIPWLRDYADIAMVVLMSLHTAHMVAQWRRISGLPERLRDGGLLGRALSDRPTFDSVLRSYESRFNSSWNEIAAVLIASVAVWLLAIVAMTSGLYPGLGSPFGASAHFSSWWANPDKNPMAFAVVIASYWLYVYLVARHAFMGVLVVGLLARARSISQAAGEAWLGYSSPWKPAEGAVSEMLAALHDVVVSITLLVSVFLIGNLYVSLPAGLEYGFVLPYAFLNPVFLIVPSVELNRHIHRSWWSLHEGAVARLGDASRAATTATRGQVAQVSLLLEARRADYDRVASLPQLVINWGALLRAVVVYFVPVVALVPAFMGR